KFASPDQCKPDEIADAFIRYADKLDFHRASASLAELASILFLVTGKSDNNSNCQLPLYLRDQVNLTTFPTVVKPRKKETNSVAVREEVIPRVLTSDKYMEVVAALKSTPHHQKVFLNHFIGFLLSDDKYVSQLWSIGHSYFALKAFKKE